MKQRRFEDDEGSRTGLRGFLFLKRKKGRQAAVINKKLMNADLPKRTDNTTTTVCLSLLDLGLSEGVVKYWPTIFDFLSKIFIPHRRGVRSWGE